MGGRRPRLSLPAISFVQSLLGFREISEMDRVNTATSPADRLYCAMGLSKNSWLLGIQFPDRRKASDYPIKGGDKSRLDGKTLRGL
jgi:hypothetical protein